MMSDERCREIEMHIEVRAVKVHLGSSFACPEGHLMGCAGVVPEGDLSDACGSIHHRAICRILVSAGWDSTRRMCVFGNLRTRLTA